MAKEDKKEEANGFLSRFKSNMADYFKDNPNAFDFTNQGGQSTSDKVAAFTDQFEGSFDKVADGFGIFQPRTTRPAGKSRIIISDSRTNSWSCSKSFLCL